MATNHTNISGPKSLPMEPEPRVCKAKSPTNTAQARGSTSPLEAGAANSNPSRAASTEITGVMAQSPESKAAPKRARSASRPLLAGHPGYGAKEPAWGKCPSLPGRPPGA